MALLLLSACGRSETLGPRTTTDDMAGAGVTPSSSVMLAVSGNPTAAPTNSTDRTLTISPALYTDPGNPCAGTSTSEFVGDGDPHCAARYVSAVSTTVIAGPDVLTRSPQTRRASYDPGLSADTARTVGTAFFVSEAIRAWAISLNEGRVLPLLDGRGQAADVVNEALEARPVRQAYVRPCMFATRVRIAHADGDVQSYLQSRGWSAPSNTAVVATYAPCDGITITYTGGTNTTILAHTQTMSVVITGSVNDMAPFGPLFVEDGWAVCDSRAVLLRSLCG